MAIYRCCECDEFKDTDVDNYTDCPKHHDEFGGMCDGCVERKADEEDRDAELEDEL